MLSVNPVLHHAEGTGSGPSRLRSGKNVPLALDEALDEFHHRFDAAQRAHAFVIDSEIGASDLPLGHYRNQIVIGAGDERVQDADASAGAHGLGLAKR